MVHIVSDRRVGFWLLNFKGAKNIQRNLISFIGIDTGMAGTLNLDLTSYGICARPLSIVIVWGGVLLVFWAIGVGSVKRLRGMHESLKCLT